MRSNIKTFFYIIVFSFGLTSFIIVVVDKIFNLFDGKITNVLLEIYIFSFFLVLVISLLNKKLISGNKPKHIMIWLGIVIFIDSIQKIIKDLINIGKPNIISNIIMSIILALISAIIYIICLLYIRVRNKYFNKKLNEYQQKFKD